MVTVGMGVQDAAQIKPLTLAIRQYWSSFWAIYGHGLLCPWVDYQPDQIVFPRGHLMYL